MRSRGIDLSGIKRFLRSLTLLDYTSIALILAHLILLFANRNMLPFGFDTPYHLLMGKMYADFDRVVPWDYYEFAPVGRPQLYPPFEHILIWWIHDGFGLDYIEIGRLIAIVQYPLTLFLSWLVIRLLFDDITAASFLGLLSADGKFWSWQLTVAPTAMILALYMPFLYFFLRKRRYIATALLTIFLYSHLGMPYTIMLSLAISVVLMYKLDRSYLREAIFVVCLSLILFLPWMFHVLNNLDALRANLAKGRLQILGFLTMNIPTLFLIPVGIYACFKEKLKGRLFIGSFLGFFSILFTYGWRYFIHAPLVNSAVAALGYKKIVGRMINRKLIVTVTLAFIAINSLFSFSLVPIGRGRPPQGPRILEPSPLARELTTMVSEEPKAWGAFSLNNPDLIALADWITENTREDEIIHVMVGPLADAITLLTGRRTDHGMYPEVRTEEMFRTIAQGRKSGIFVLTKEQLKKMKLFRIKSEILAVFGEFVIVYATGEIKPLDILALPISLYIRLPDLKRVDQGLFNEWLNLIRELRPERVSIGVHQKDIEDQKLAQFISEAKEIVRMVEVSVFTVDPGRVEESIRFLISTSGDKIDALRICGKPEIISPELLAGVKEEIGPKELGIGIIGFPGEEIRAWKNPKEIFELADYLVRHVPPSADFILHAMQVDVEAFGRFGKPIFVQIDLSMIRLMDETAPLLNLIAAIHQTDASGILIEFDDPSVPPNIREFLKKALSHP